MARRKDPTLRVFFQLALQEQRGREGWGTRKIDQQIRAMLAVIILSGGESRRMGRPKALVPFPEGFFSSAAKTFKGRPAAQSTSEPRLAPAKTNEATTAGLKAGATTSETMATGAELKTQERAADSTLGGTAEKPKTFLEHLIEVTRHPRAEILRVVVGAHADEIRARVKMDEGVMIVNKEWQRGQLSSLQAGIRSLPEGETEGMLVCLVDHPLISTEVVARVIGEFDKTKNKIVIPTYRGKRGHPAIFPSAMYAELLAAPENIGARAVVQAHAADVLEVPVEEEGVVLNLNDPEALGHALPR
ncbi:MAG: nucleotidyltransferase family protein [Candidatus Acidiferrales bacterium]